MFAYNHIAKYWAQVKAIYLQPFPVTKQTTLGEYIQRHSEMINRVKERKKG